MVEQKIAPNVEPDYSPEIKLRVVLEYIRNPKRKMRIIKDNGISEELLEQWHQEFVERASLSRSRNAH
jgi:transposase-like protein